MSTKVLTPARQLDLLMPDGYWYRSEEAFPDNVPLLQNLLGGAGEFILCSGDNDPKGPHETLVRAAFVQAIRWVEP